MSRIIFSNKYLHKKIAKIGYLLKYLNSFKAQSTVKMFVYLLMDRLVQVKLTH